MATSTSTIKAILTMDTKQFKNGAKDADRSMKSLGSSAKMVGNQIKAAIGIGSIAGFTMAIKSSLDYQNSLIDLSDRLGVSTEGLSRLHHAAELSGVSQSTLNMGLQRMVRRVAEAAQGTGEAVKALDELGLSAAAMKQVAPEEQFKVLADALKAVEAPADRTRLAMKLFDSEGVALLQTMTEGAAGLDEMGAAADAAGKTVSTKAAMAAREANAAFIQLGAAGSGLTNVMAVQLAPTLTETARWLGDVLPDAVGVTSDAFRGLQAIFQGLSSIGNTAFAKWVEGLATVDVGITELINSIPTLSAETSTVLQDLAETSKEVAAQSRKAFEDLIAKPMPSQGLSSWADDYKVKTDSATAALMNFNLAQGVTNGDGGQAATDKLTKEAEREAQRAAKEAERAQQRLDSLNFWLMGEEGAILESYVRRQAIVDNAQANGLIGQEKHDELTAQLSEKHAKKIEDIQTATAAVQMSAYSDLFGSLAGISKTYQGKQSSTYKALFAASKAFAIAESIVKIQQGVASAASLPFPTNIPAMAGVVSATAGVVSTIRGTNIDGIAHGGLDNVPRESTYLLDKGERVLSPGQNKDLTGFLAGGGGGSGVTINIVEDSSRGGEQEQDGDDITIFVDRVKSEINADIQANRGLGRTIGQTFGLTAGGIA